MRRHALFFSAIFLCAVAASGQTRSLVQFTAGRSVPDTLKAGASTRYIVEFTEPPASERPAGRRKTGINYRDRLLADAGIRLKSAGVSLPYFEQVFHGTALTLDEVTAARVLALPYVKRMAPDATVTAYTVSGAERMAAPAVWQLGFTGKGIRIGILDTGIDYLHPVMGGGFGPGFKVRGGWDFVADDADPMDVNGHGTHVASIAAARSTGFNGVAPDAEIWAYKVLDDRGRGTTAHILAAMDRALDPNGDGDYSDRMHIINMSLGSEDGLESDPVSEAADRLMRAGVLVVAAAGNAGHPMRTPGWETNYMNNGSQTIGSPGTSRLALTVGSITSTGLLSDFSSKGPVPVSYAVKPDVTAVGGSVNAAVPGGGFGVKSGTSMAAPAVAGLAALLLEKRPALTAMQLKSIIVASAKAGTVSPAFQGTGEVDATRALHQELAFSPVSISFGLDPLTTGSASLQRTVYVRNLGTAPATVDLSAEAPAGTALRLQPARVTIPAGDSIAVTAVLDYVRTSVPIVPGNVALHAGRISAVSGERRAALVFQLARANRVELRFTADRPSLTGAGAEDYFVTGGRGKYNRFYWLDARTAEVVGIKGGSYDLIGSFEEGLSVPHLYFGRALSFPSNGGSLTIDHRSAVHDLSMQMTDDKGTLLSAYPLHRWQIRMEPKPGVAYSFSSATVTTVRVPAFAPGEPLFVQHAAMNPESGVLVVPPYLRLDGIQAARTVTTDRARLVHVPVRMERLSREAGPAVLIAEPGLGIAEAIGWSIAASFYAVMEVPEIAGDARFSFITGKKAAGPYLHHTTFRLGSRHPANPDLVMISTETESVWADENGAIRADIPFEGYVPGPVVAPSDTLRFGDAPVYPFMRSSLNVFGRGSLKMDPLLRGGYRELRFDIKNATAYRILDANGQTVRSGTFFDGSPLMEGLPDRSDIELSYTHPFRPAGEARVTYRQPVDFTRADPNAPALRYLSLRDAANRVRDRFEQGEDVRVVLHSSVIHFMGERLPDPGATRVYWRVNGDPEWTEAPLTWSRLPAGGEGIRFEAPLTGATARNHSAVDIRLVLADSTGNRAEFTFDPAFSVGTWQGRPVAGTPVGRPARLAVETYPNPFNPEAAVMVELPAAGRLDVRLFDVSGREVALLFSGRQPAGVHRFRLDGGSLATGVYLLRVQTGSARLTRKVTLLR